MTPHDRLAAAKALRAAADKLLVITAMEMARPALGVSLRKAADIYRSQGHADAVDQMTQRVRDLFNPAGKEDVRIDYPALPWLTALGTTQQRNVVGILEDLNEVETQLGREKLLGPDDKGAAGRRQQIVALLDVLVKKVESLDRLMMKVTKKTPHGPFHIVGIPGVSGDKYDEALQALDAATEKVKPLFPEVLYGDVYLTTSMKHHGRRAAAGYVFDNDTMHLNVNAKHRVDDVYSIIHELGHRFDNKFIDRKLRAAFTRLSLGGKAVSEYGGTDPRENFAEAFAHYVLGMELDPTLKELLEKMR